MSDKAENNTNPCGICRAMGASGCKGHGGGGGGSGDGDDSENEDNLDNQLKSKQFLEIAPIISKEWQLMDNGLCTFDDFNQNAALSSIHLDYIEHEMVLKPKENLNTEEEQDKSALFDHIADHVEKIGGEVTFNNGQMDIDMSKSPQDFPSLISNLIENNLIPANDSGMKASVDSQEVKQEVSQEYTSSVVSWPPAPPGFSASSDE